MEAQREKPSASDVACYIIQRKKLNNESITGYQLEKLLYYCQVWSLVVNKRPLFDDDILAFKNGPVVRGVISQHQGRITVPENCISGDSSRVSGADVSVIEAVLSSYGGFSGDYLVALTHREDPWVKSFNGNTSPSSSAVIPMSVLEDYYTKLISSDYETRLLHHVPKFDHPANIYVSESDFAWLESFLEEEPF